MSFTTIAYSTLPDDAKMIRTAVFEVEQGFYDEYDEIDSIATHLVMYDGDTPIACCRHFVGENCHLIGRLAVMKSHRGLGIGKKMMQECERSILACGGKKAMLHAQLRAKEFYEKCGYTPACEPDDEQGCPHIWMQKEL